MNSIATIITRLSGGAGALALHGACGLDPDRYSTTVITGHGDPALLSRAAEAGLEVVLEPWLRRPIDPVRDPVALSRMTRLLRGRDFDVVHTHCAKAGALGRLAAHRAGVPRIIHTYHGFPFHQFQSAARRQSYVSIERWLGRFTDLALCVGAPVAAEAIRRRLVTPDRVRSIGVVASGPVTEGAAARDRARALLGVPAAATVVGTVGRLTRQKAPEDFLAALRALDRPGVVGVWIGGGDLADRVARSAGGLPRGKVVLAGERTDAVDLLPAFDVFALPSWYEGLPTAVVEAMMARVPVVSTAVNAVPEVVVPGETGLLVPPRRPAALAGAIGYLLDHPRLAAELADNARKRLGDRFTVPALTSVLESAYGVRESSAFPRPVREPVGAGSRPAECEVGGRAWRIQD
jgi:glycosyltransferase involved in cell wall biosynthesis